LKKLPKKIAIFGGTFNPLHIGHLAIAEAVRERLRLEKIIFVPSRIPPHKSKVKLAASPIRFNMVKSAIKGNPAFGVSDSEIKRQGKSYSVDTLRYFRKIYGKKTQLYFIIGSDSLPELKKWREIGNILNLCRFIVVNRPGYALKNLPARAIPIVIPGFEVSSSKIRQFIVRGRSIKYLVPDAVLKIIQRHKLYR
jgi:nicotinate-nucleotide adenylyltransferase